MGNFEFIMVITLSLLGFGGATEIFGGLEPRSPGLAPPLYEGFCLITTEHHRYASNYYRQNPIQVAKNEGYLLPN